MVGSVIYYGVLLEMRAVGGFQKDTHAITSR